MVENVLAAKDILEKGGLPLQFYGSLIKQAASVTNHLAWLNHLCEMEGALREVQDND